MWITLYIILSHMMFIIARICDSKIKYLGGSDLNEATMHKEAPKIVFMAGMMKPQNLRVAWLCRRISIRIRMMVGRKI